MTIYVLKWEESFISRALGIRCYRIADSLGDSFTSLRPLCEGRCCFRLFENVSESLCFSEDVIEIKRGFCVHMITKMSSEVSRKVVFHVITTKNITFKLFKQVIKIKVEVVCTSMLSEFVILLARSSTHIILATFVLIRQYFISFCNFTKFFFRIGTIIFIWMMLNG